MRDGNNGHFILYYKKDFYDFLRGILNEIEYDKISHYLEIAVI